MKAITKWVQLFAVVAVGVLTSLAFPGAALAGPKPPLATPTIQCDTDLESTNFIDILFTAGATPGAPAGFSIQWETEADFNQFGWPAESDCPLDINGNPTCPASFCKGGFSGNANLSRYTLTADQWVVVRIGDLLFDNGASTSDACAVPLVCGTTYVFRAFAHANNSYMRSAFTPELTGSTVPCDAPNGCTLTQGYWKNHNNEVCETDPTSPLCVTWPVTTLKLGNNTYTVAQLVSILSQPVGGNGVISLSHQLIAAKLNIANGADGSAIASTIASADSTIGNTWVPPVNPGYLPPGTTSALVTALNNYNTGVTGPGHCDDKEP
jgi:hypothetical protein